MVVDCKTDAPDAHVLLQKNWIARHKSLLLGQQFFVKGLTPTMYFGIVLYLLILNK